MELMTVQNCLIFIKSVNYVIRIMHHKMIGKTHSFSLKSNSIPIKVLKVGNKSSTNCIPNGLSMCL